MILIFRSSALTWCLRRPLRGSAGGQVWIGGCDRDCTAAEVRYARADDDMTIAYLVAGDGPVTRYAIVVVSP